MTTEKEMLRRKTERHYMAVVFLNGVKNIRYDRRKRTIFLSAALAVLLLTGWLCHPGRYMLPILWQVAAIGYSASALAVLAAVTYWLGRVPHARQYYEDFLRIGWANSAGEPPVLTEYREIRDKLVELHFYSKGLLGRRPRRTGFYRPCQNSASDLRGLYRNGQEPDAPAHDCTVT